MHVDQTRQQDAVVQQGGRVVGTGEGESPVDDEDLTDIAVRQHRAPYPVGHADPLAVAQGSGSLSSVRFNGRMPERPKGAVCKIAGEAYGGSNPPPPTNERTGGLITEASGHLGTPLKKARVAGP